ncbi:hypothetical protein [Chamaesiphon sp. VAR_48_metabat_135_sub]|nr:hypothetical protein [Chamaesiphon sp. VAR_48_metabat_135_sub]
MTISIDWLNFAEYLKYTDGCDRRLDIPEARILILDNKIVALSTLPITRF